MTVPAEAMLFAGTEAVSCVALTNVVVRAVLPQYIVEPEMKPAPFTVKVNAAPPALVNAGDMFERLGAGLGGMVMITGTTGDVETLKSSLPW